MISFYRTLLWISTILVLINVLHPGRTDSKGGHYNRSTGEYHYHHGYSEHQHYDIDGDGKKDCPYEFDDKTNHNSNGSQSNNNRYDYDGDQSIASNTEQNKKRITFWDIIKAIFIIILSLFLAALGGLCYLPFFVYLIIASIETIFKLCFHKKLSEITYGRISTSLYIILSLLIAITIIVTVLTNHGII